MTRIRRCLRTLCASVMLLCMARGASAQSRVLRIPSRILGEQRVLHVTLPPHYDLARQRYPVVYLLDGQVRAFHDVTVATVSYDLVSGVRDYAMPRQIVVGIEQVDRRTDLATNDGAFYRFLTDEVIPLVERSYRTLPYRTLVGHSLGGRFALMAACRTPIVFQAIVAISAGVGDSASSGSAIQCLRTPETSGRRTLVLAAGSGETRALTAIDRIAQFVRDSASQAWRVAHVADAGVSHTDAPLRSIPAALQFVYAADLWEIAPSLADSIASGNGDVDAMLERGLAAVRLRMGFPVPMSFKWRALRATQLLAHGTPEQAVAAARLLLAEYPEELQGYTNLADASIRARDYGAARTALNNGLSLLRKRADFDETQRSNLEHVLRQALADLPK